MERRAGESDDEHGLFLVTRVQYVLRLFQRRRGGEIGEGRGAFLPRAKLLHDGGFDLGRFHVAEDGDHAVVRNGERGVKLFQVGDLEVLHALLGAAAVQAVAGVAEESLAREAEGAGEQFIFLRAKIGELDLAFAFESSGGEGRVQQDIREKVEAGLEVAAHHLGIHAEAVVPTVGVEVSADGFNLRGNLLGAAGLGALHEHLRKRGSNAVVRGRFGEDAAFQRGAEFDERQAVVFLHQQAEAVGKVELLDGVVGVFLFGVGDNGGRTLGKERVERAILLGEMGAGDALQVRRRDAFHRGEVTLGEVQVAG